MRRVCYAKYYNCMSWFDLFAGNLDYYAFKLWDWWLQFDSVESWWLIKKKSMMAVWARYKLRDEITLKDSSDELSQVLIGLD